MSHKSLELVARSGGTFSSKINDKYLKKTTLVGIETKTRQVIENKSYLCLLLKDKTEHCQ